MQKNEMIRKAAVDIAVTSTKFVAMLTGKLLIGAGTLSVGAGNFLLGASNSTAVTSVTSTINEKPSKKRSFEYISDAHDDSKCKTVKHEIVTEKASVAISSITSTDKIASKKTKCFDAGKYYIGDLEKIKPFLNEGANVFQLTRNISKPSSVIQDVSVINQCVASDGKVFVLTSSSFGIVPLSSMKLPLSLDTTDIFSNGYVYTFTDQIEVLVRSVREDSGNICPGKLIVYDGDSTNILVYVKNIL